MAAIVRRRLRRLGAAFLVALGASSAPGASQTPGEPSADLLALAQQMPNCREFRNACQVCVRLADGKLGCSNIGIACNPSGDWRCSIPAPPEAGAK